MHPEVLNTCTRYSHANATANACMHVVVPSGSYDGIMPACMWCMHAEGMHACTSACMHATHRCVWHACLGTRRARIFAPRCPRADTCSLTAASYRNRALPESSPPRLPKMRQSESGAKGAALASNSRREPGVGPVVHADARGCEHEHTRRPKRKVGAVNSRTVCRMYAWSHVRMSGASSAGRGSGCLRCMYIPALCGMCVDVYTSYIGGGGVGLHWCSLSPPSSRCGGSRTLPTPTRPLQMGARNWRFCDRMRQVCVGACSCVLSSARFYPTVH